MPDILDLRRAAPRTALNGPIPLTEIPKNAHQCPLHVHYQEPDVDAAYEKMGRVVRAGVPAFPTGDRAREKSPVPTL